MNSQFSVFLLLNSYNIFNSKSGGPGNYHFNYELSEYVRKHIEMKNFIKKFGAALNSELLKTNGDILLISPSQIALGDVGPSWERIGDLKDGMQILVGNTEQSFVYKLSYQYDQNTKKWEGEFYFKVTDNFGLDREDVEDLNWMAWIIGVPKSIYLGFSSWWHLQHRRCFTPFVTDIQIVVKISGQL